MSKNDLTIAELKQLISTITFFQLGARTKELKTFVQEKFGMDLFKKHYSHRPYADGRETKLFCGPGEKIVLRTWECDAMFVWRKYINDAGEEGINCSIFRNESQTKSSTLIKQADEIAFAVWPDRRHYTYVNAEKIKSVNPGYCFKKAGWRECGVTKVHKHIILEKYENA